MLSSARKKTREKDGTWLELVQVHASLATKWYTVETKQVRRTQTHTQNYIKRNQKRSSTRLALVANKFRYMRAPVAHKERIYTHFI